jgi:hypothetical protein
MGLASEKTKNKICKNKFISTELIFPNKISETYENPFHLPIPRRSLA